MAVAPPLPERVRPPFTPQPDFPPRADVPPHPAGLRRDIPLHRDMDFYSAPIMTDTITDVANWAQPDAGYAQPAREQIWDAGSSQLADWIIEDANQQAAEITRAARNQASNSLAEAQQEAAELVRRTGEHAKLTLEAAELQAAEIRATMMKLTTDLTGMASYVTQNLTAAPPAFSTAKVRTASVGSASLRAADDGSRRPADRRARRRTCGTTRSGGPGQASRVLLGFGRPPHPASGRPVSPPPRRRPGRASSPTASPASTRPCG